MLPKTNVEPRDDPLFLNYVDAIIRSLAKSEPQDIYLIRIDNWFDHKWLKFSGIAVVPFYGHPTRGEALDEFWQDKVTFPPFHPNRVVSETYSCRNTLGFYQDQSPSQRVHQRIPSYANLQRRVENFTPSAVFVWFSSKSEPNKKASVMVYNVLGKTVNCWFAAFENQDGWRVQRVKGISKKEIETLLTSP